MTRFKDREKALELRKKEMSYSQIRDVLKVSKSTLSIWLRDYPLSKKRIRELRDRNERRIERFRDTMRKKREARLNQFYKKQKKFLFPFNKRELFIAGLFLYWGEGLKVSSSVLSISNTDPAVIKFFIQWLTECLDVSRKKLKVQLHLYTDMNINEKISFWSKTLGIPKEQFGKPYIKESSSRRINHKGRFGHGTCNVKIGGARLTENIHMAMKAIADKYNRARSSVG